MANLRFGGWARQLPPHFDVCASHVDLKIMSLLCGECVSVVGHVRGKE